MVDIVLEKNHYLSEMNIFYMSFLKPRPFQYAEDTVETKKKIKKVIRKIVSQRRTPRQQRAQDKQWYYRGVAADRATFSNAFLHKNELVSPPPPRYRSMYSKDGFRRRDDRDTDRGDPVDNFLRTAKPSDDIETIPGMTVGFDYVLRLLDIDTIAQMLAKLLSFIDGANDTQEVLQAYFTWLRSMATGTIASQTDMNAIVRVMGQYAIKAGVLDE